MYFFEAGSWFKQLLFHKKKKKQSLEVKFQKNLVVRNEAHCIYTWKDFLTIIYSFKYTMGWSEIIQFFIAENSKQCMNVITGFVTNVNFSKAGTNCGILKQA